MSNFLSLLQYTQLVHFFLHCPHGITRGGRQSADGAINDNGSDTVRVGEKQPGSPFPLLATDRFFSFFSSAHDTSAARTLLVYPDPVRDSLLYSYFPDPVSVDMPSLTPDHGRRAGAAAAIAIKGRQADNQSVSRAPSLVTELPLVGAMRPALAVGISGACYTPGQDRTGIVYHEDTSLPFLFSLPFPLTNIHPTFQSPNTVIESHLQPLRSKRVRHNLSHHPDPLYPAWFAPWPHRRRTRNLPNPR